MSTVVHEFLAACRAQYDMHSLDNVITCQFEQSLISRLRVFLVNLNVDEEQEEFLLSHLRSKDLLVEIPGHIVQHIAEFLQGASR